MQLKPAGSPSSPTPTSLLDLPPQIIALIIDEIKADDEDEDDDHYATSETDDSDSDCTWTGSSSDVPSEDEDPDAQMEHGEAAFIELTEGFRGIGDDESAFKLEELMAEWPSVLRERPPMKRLVPWPSFNSTYYLSLVCRKLRSVMEELGYWNNLKLHYDEYECKASMAIPEVMRGSVRKITMIFSDVVALGKNTPSLTQFLSKYPNARCLEIIWKNTWPRHDPRWASIISGPEHTGISNITHLDLRIDNAVSSVHLRNPWRFHFLVSHLRLPAVRHFTLSRQCSLEGTQEYKAVEDRTAEAFGELAEVYQKWPSLESVDMELTIGLHMKHRKSFWVCPLRQFLLSGLKTRCRNHLHITYDGLEKEELHTFDIEDPTIRKWLPRDASEVAAFISEHDEALRRPGPVPSFRELEDFPDFDLSIRFPDWNRRGEHFEVMRLQYRDRKSNIGTDIDGARTENLARTLSARPGYEGTLQGVRYDRGHEGFGLAIGLNRLVFAIEGMD